MNCLDEWLQGTSAMGRLGSLGFAWVRLGSLGSAWVRLVPDIFHQFILVLPQGQAAMGRDGLTRTNLTTDPECGTGITEST
jgi:hypothetical protein